MFKVFTKVSEFTTAREKVTHQRIGLVPTMGNLHEGHLSLIKKSVENNQLTIVTIFVNPTQFGPNEDFQSYPRTLDQDLEMIRSLSSKSEIWVLAPESINEMYPEGFATTISVSGELTNKLCGPIRPSHFEGVATIVYLLFQITKAHRAYFGQKDFQQTRVIKRMTKDLMLPVQIEVLPIVRDKSGLALSSRNQYLNSEQKKEALALYEYLSKTQRILNELGPDKALEFTKNAKSNDLRLEYLELLDADNLSAPNSKTNDFVIAGVLKINKTRLLDNILVENKTR